MMSTAERDALEHLLDTHGLTAILDGLVVICREKATHLESAWQDPDSMRDWDTTALKIERRTADLAKYCPLA